MARKSVFSSQHWIWLSLFIALSAGIAVCSWQSEVQTRRERNWALKTSGEMAPLVVKTIPVIREEPREPDQEVTSDSHPSQVEIAPQTESTEIASAEPIAPTQQPLLPPIAGEVEKEPAPVIEEKPAVTEVAASPVTNDSKATIPAQPIELPESEPKASTKPICFAQPTALCTDLELLNESGAFARFADATAREIEILMGHETLAGAGVRASLSRIEMLRRTGLDLAAAHPADSALTVHLRVVHGLTRRLEIWKAAIEATPTTQTVGLSAAPVTEVANRLRDELHKSAKPSASNWERFLLLDDLLSVRSGGVVSENAITLLKRIAARVHSENLSDEQKAFLFFGPPRDLIAAIDLYLTEPLSTVELLSAIEEFEVEPTNSRGAKIATAIAQMSLTHDRRQVALAEKLGNFYRAANVRVAVAESLINELIPSPENSSEPVNDHLMGARVTGRSNVSTKLRVQLVPDRTTWRVGLEATGNVASNTQAFHGPFTFFNQGWANYRARTTVGLGKRGFDVNQPTAEASSQTDLLDLQSDFDGIPLFGLLARSVARQQHAHKQIEAEWEVEGRMARRIEQKLDQELNSQIRKAEAEWTNRVAQPLEGLRLNPTTIAMETTNERLIARYRVGGDTQLAAHTARPLAPSDSVLSVQIHASAINNFIEQLQLNGKTYKLEDLYLHLNKAMGSTDVTIPDEMPAGVFVRFADEDSLRMDIRNGEAEMTVRLAEIRQGKTKWKNVQVRGRFVPKINGLHAELERTSYIELKGDGLKRIGGGQVILRMAFSSVLSRVSGVPLMHPKLTTHPKMQGYVIRQFALEDGWIGLAVGPKLATANNDSREEKTETARRPRSPVLDNILRR